MAGLGVRRARRGGAAALQHRCCASAARSVCRPMTSSERIAAILSAYDDLIENNTRRIAILEEMARRSTRSGSSTSASPATSTCRSSTPRSARSPKAGRSCRLARVARVQSTEFDPSRVADWRCSPIVSFTAFARPDADAGAGLRHSEQQACLRSPVRLRLAELDPRIPRIWPIMTVPTAKPVWLDRFLPLLTA